MRRLLLGYVRTVDRINIWVGVVSRWLILACVAICAATALLRYALNTGYVWMQQSYVVCYALVFLLLAGYAYLRDQHVRVDILFARMDRRRRAWVEVAGILVFLLPWVVVLAIAATPFILGAWRTLEGSAEAGGLPGIFLLKTVIWLFCGLLGAQALSQLVKNGFVLAGDEAIEPHRPGGTATGFQ